MAHRFLSGHHVLVDASGAGGGRYVMALLELSEGQVLQELMKPCVSTNSVDAEVECIEWALRLKPQATIWNDCTPALDRMLKKRPELASQLLWPSPKMRAPFHNRVHALSVLARTALAA